MKILFLLLFTLTTVSSVSAQSFYGAVFEEINHKLTLVSDKEKPANLVGSPYYHNDFIRGTLNLENKKPMEVYLRYNVAEEVMEIKTNMESSEIYQLPIDPKIYYVINSEKYLLDKIFNGGKEIHGYFIELFNGENLRLVKKPGARFTEGEKAKSSYEQDTPSKISIEEEYYIISEGDVINVRPKSKDVKKAFQSSEAQQFLKNNKIKTEADLIGFVSYLDKEKS